MGLLLLVAYFLYVLVLVFTLSVFIRKAGWVILFSVLFSIIPCLPIVYMDFMSSRLLEEFCENEKDFFKKMFAKMLEI